METKSRYEVIADLEKEKMALIREKASLGDAIKAAEFEIKQIKRHLEDKEEALKNLGENRKSREEMLDLLIKSKEDSLARFAVQAK